MTWIAVRIGVEVTGGRAAVSALCGVPLVHCQASGWCDGFTTAYGITLRYVYYCYYLYNFVRVVNYGVPM